ncbi:collagen binding domain-containing protein [Enterococcus alcedinis]|uniref:MSCRAMM family protein n=1 Tax=Enterococcus alcedinis TaxID=1274384 RepID=UPI003623A482
MSLGKFTKVNQNGDKLVGVKFQLFKADGTTSLSTERTSNTNGEVDFSNINLPVGTYKLRETHTLPGYETIADKTITVTDTGTTSVNLVLTGLDERPNEPGNQVVNHLRLFTLKVTKEDNRGDPLEGATFTLKRTLPTPETPITGTTNQNIFTYAGLSAGTYILTETGTPNGYIGVEPMTIVISANGQVTIDGTAYTPTTTEGETLIQLTVKNRQKGQLPSTGGQGTQQFLIATLVLVALAGAIGIYYVYRNRKGAE